MKFLNLVNVTCISAACLTASTVYAAEPNTSAQDIQTTSSIQDMVNAVLEEHPGAVQISPNEVSFKNGAVILAFPNGKEAAESGSDVHANGTVYGCPDGAYCFYEHANWGGRRLTFSDCSASGTVQSLWDYGFGNMTTSWVNNKNAYVVVKASVAGPDVTLWNENAFARSANVGAGANDRADYFICYL